MLSAIFKSIGWGVLAILKFVFTPGLMIAAESSFLETFLTTSISAIIGVTIFYYFGGSIFAFVSRMRKKKKKIFSKGSRRLVAFKKRYGLFGLAVASGVISVPLCGLLAAKYFTRPWKVLPILYLSFSLWALILTYLALSVKAI